MLVMVVHKRYCQLNISLQYPPLHSTSALYYDHSTQRTQPATMTSGYEQHCTLGGDIKMKDLELKVGHQTGSE